MVNKTFRLTAENGFFTDVKTDSLKTAQQIISIYDENQIARKVVKVEEM